MRSVCSIDLELALEPRVPQVGERQREVGGGDLRRLALVARRRSPLDARLEVELERGGRGGAVELEQQRVHAAARLDVEAHAVGIGGVDARHFGVVVVEARRRDAHDARSADGERPLPGPERPRVVLLRREEHLGGGLEADAHERVRGERRLEVGARQDDVAVAHQVDALDRAGAGDLRLQATLRGALLSRAHRLAVEVGLEDHAPAGGGVGLQRLERVEDDVVGQRVGPHAGEPRLLRVERLAHRDRVARQRAVIVGAADEADLEAALEVEVAEPLEGAVAGGDLDQLLHLGVVARPVAGVVRVRNDEDVVRIGFGAQPLVEEVEIVRLLHADQVVVGRAEQDVVVAALAPLRRPLVAEVGDESSLVVVLARELLQAPPLPVVHQRVVLRHGEEVELGVVAAEAVVVLGGALTLGEPRVAVGLAPVEAPALALAHPDRVAGAGHRAVGGAGGEPVDAGSIDLQVGERGDAADRRGHVARRLTIELQLVGGDRARRPVVPAILAAQRELERFTRRDDRGRERAHRPGVALADHRERRPARRQEVTLPLQVDVDRQQQTLDVERLHLPAARALRPIAVGHRRRLAGIERARGDLVDDGGGVAVLHARVHAAELDAGGLEAHGGVRGADRDVVVAGRILVLVGALVGHHLGAEQEGGARAERRAADGVGLLDGGEAPRDQRLLVLEAQRADRVRPLLLERELGGEAVDVAQQVGRRRRAVEANAADFGDATGKVDRDVAAVERELVGPLPEHRGALLERGGVGRGRRDLFLERFDARAQIGLQVVGAALRLGGNAGRERERQGDEEGRDRRDRAASPAGSVH